MNTYICEEFESNPKFGRTLICTALTMSDARAQMEAFLSRKLPQARPIGQVWELNTATNQTTFVGGLDTS